ncbi:YifB family Mg chelatase-like AAA ATPase [Gorillibacterium sp. sgz5001074]|uniref:YifB family Mg chelatase-like AAA ATPase n=1 Tax=Gorillibacterium sp. sgz5001074 TaxID=3446695 RepID=UPI003F67C527
MYGKMISACVHGIDGALVEVETDISNGLPAFQVVGLPDSAIRESTERVRAALKNCGFTFPMERITVNLAPADVRKEGCAFDLAIAAGILTASGQIGPKYGEHTLWIGELSLDGTLRPVPGVLSMVHCAAQQGIRQVILPAENAREAQLISGMEIWTLRSLRELAPGGRGAERSGSTDGELAASGEAANSGGEAPSHETPADHLSEDYADVCGQHQAKRALMIAAAGLHNLLFIGPPGTGKTMLVRRLPTILPEMEDEEALEVTKIYSIAGKLKERGQLIRTRPFRSPHHTVSSGGLIGGGSIPKPGEVSLAHRGVLFLDELPEFGRGALEVLRQPLEDRSVTIGRARAVFTYPAHVLLAASMNPCPCGYYGSESLMTPCSCSPLKILQYRARISGPLLDRIDLHVEVPRTRYADLAPSQDLPLSSARMREQVRQARHMQEHRYAGSRYRFNGELSGQSLRRYCRPTREAEALLAETFEALGLSVRAHDRILKLARTIADLEESDAILEAHVAEAVQYRNLDKTNKPLG